MTTIEETWAMLCDVNRRGGIIGHDSPHDEPVRPCPACENVRAALLAVLEEALEAVGTQSHTVLISRVSNLRRRIEELGK